MVMRMLGLNGFVRGSCDAAAALCADVAGCGIIASLCCIRKIFCSDVHTVQGLDAK